MDECLFVEFGESTGALDWGDVEPIALATPKLMACYLVDAEVRDAPPEEEFKAWLWAIKGDRMIRAYGAILAPCLFYLPVRPPKFEKLYERMAAAIKAGKLPLRDRDTLYPFPLEQVADIEGNIRDDGYVSVADVWKWQRASGVPTLKTAKELWKWCNPALYGWYGRYQLPDADESNAKKRGEIEGKFQDVPYRNQQSWMKANYDSFIWRAFEAGIEPDRMKIIDWLLTTPEGKGGKRATWARIKIETRITELWGEYCVAQSRRRPWETFSTEERRS